MDDFAISLIMSRPEHSDQSHKVAPSTRKSHDPFDCLPVEVALYMFQFIHREDLLSVMQVCPLWSKALRREMLRHFIYKRNLTMEAFDSYLYLYFEAFSTPPPIQSFDCRNGAIPYCWNDTPKNLSDFMDHDKRYLMLQRALAAGLRVDNLLIDFFSEVRLAKFGRESNIMALFRNLRKLTLQLIEATYPDDVHELFCNMANLEELDISISRAKMLWDRLEPKQKNTFPYLRKLRLRSIQGLPHSEASKRFTAYFFNHNSFKVLDTVQLERIPIEESQLRDIISPNLKVLLLYNNPFLKLSETLKTCENACCRLRQFSFCDLDLYEYYPHKVDPWQPGIDLTFLCRLTHLDLSTSALTFGEFWRILSATDKHILEIAVTILSPIQIQDFDKLARLCPALHSLTIRGNFSEQARQVLIGRLTQEAPQLCKIVLGLDSQTIQNIDSETGYRT